MNATRTAVAGLAIVCCAGCCFWSADPSHGEASGKTGRSSQAVVCAAKASRDQDDMCIWVHPTDRPKSTIIAADKAAEKLFVYDRGGKVIQSVAAAKPGNIDLRYNFPLGGKTVDIVAMNRRKRGDYAIVVFKVDPATRRLERIDNGKIATGENYGGTLFRSRRTGKFYFITTAKGGRCEQYKLADDGRGKVKGTKVRTWRAGYSEGAVGDDEGGRLYIGQEDKGVWELGGEPTDPAPGKLVLKVGTHGLKADVEGLAIYRLAGKARGYLLVSNQGRDNFKVFELAGEHKYIGTFTIAGAKETDGIDVTNVNLGGRFAGGLFACHTHGLRGVRGCPVLLTPWSDIATSLDPPLTVHTSHDPRK